MNVRRSGQVLESMESHYQTAPTFQKKLQLMRVSFVLYFITVPNTSTAIVKKLLVDVYLYTVAEMHKQNFYTVFSHENTLLSARSLIKEQHKDPDTQ